MADVLCVYVGRTSLPNLEHGLTHGRWAFTRESPGVSAVSAGDLVLFATGFPGGPRAPSARWQAGRLGEAFLARALGGPYVATAPFWLDEGATLLYNPSVDIEFLGSLGAIALRPGVDLSAAVVDALRESGINQSQGVLAPTARSPALAAGRGATVPGLASVGPSTTATRARPGATGTRFVPVERQWTEISVRAVPSTQVTATRREQKLVSAYRDHLVKQRHVVARLEINVEGTVLRSDLVDRSRLALIEAKARSTATRYAPRSDRSSTTSASWRRLRSSAACSCRRNLPPICLH
jgi:hypothetical protein